MTQIYDIINIMVRIINSKNVDKIASFVYGALLIQKFFTHIIEINNPLKVPCIYAMWHENQFCIHGIEDKAHLNVLISNSADGEIIARAVEKWGFRVVRGSSNRKGCVSSTMQLISRIKEGECAALMVDGPRGPLHKVKGGVITLAKETGAPIIPMHWFSREKTFVTLPSWDKMKTPLFNCHIINLYGDPIYVSKDDKDEDIAARIKSSLEELEKLAPAEFDKAKKNKLWKK